MDNIFSDIFEKFHTFEEELAETVPFLETEGNVYLVRGSILQAIYLKQEYQKLLKLKLNFQDIKVIQEYLPLLQGLLEALIANMDYEVEAGSALEDILENDLTDSSATIELYVEFKYWLQKLLTKILEYLSPDFGLQTVPIRSIQAALEAKISEFNFALPDNQLRINLDELPGTVRIAGKLSALQFQKIETESSYFSRILSCTSEFLELFSHLNAAQPDYFASASFVAIFTAAIMPIYEEIVGFSYDQLLINKITWPEVQRNFHEKFPSIKNLLLQKVSEILLGNVDSMELTLEFPLREVIDLLKEELLQLEENELFDVKNLKLYQSNFRDVSEFEQKYFEAEVAIDIYDLISSLANNPILLTTAIVTPALQFYEESALYICGADWNSSWTDITLQERNLTDWQKIGLESDLNKEASVMDVGNSLQNALALAD